MRPVYLSATDWKFCRSEAVRLDLKTRGAGHGGSASAYVRRLIALARVEPWFTQGQTSTLERADKESCGVQSSAARPPRESTATSTAADAGCGEAQVAHSADLTRSFSPTSPAPAARGTDLSPAYVANPNSGPGGPENFEYRWAGMKYRVDSPDVPELEQEGWVVEHIDPRYQTRLMRRPVDAKPQSRLAYEATGVLIAALFLLTLVLFAVRGYERATYDSQHDLIGVER